MKLTPTALALLFLLRSIASAQSVIDSSLTVQQLVSGLSAPTGMAFVSANDILVLQKNDGRVRRVIAGVLQAGEVLDVAVDNDSERGLLGIALHPQFPATPFVYLYFTESSTGADTAGSPTPLGNRVYRYTWNGSKLTSPSLILALPVTPGPNHDGGVLTFGPDGKLYVVIGDLNRNGQLQNFPSGPPPDDTGVIFRLNDDGTTPSDNPFFSQGGNVAKYYAYGIRNSFGMAFDPVTGNLWMTENGPNLYDEINLVEPGFNSGWEQLMGPDARDPQGVANLFAIPGAHYRDPSFSWLDTVGSTGLVFLDSTALGPQYLNNMFVGDINGGVLYRFRLDASRAGFEFQNPALADLVADNSSELSELVFGTGFGGITDIKVGPDGFLYIVSFSGRILVISPVKPVVTITAPDATATEAGATTGFFSVSRTGSTASSLTVNYTVGGSATHGVDYNSLPGNVIIPAGAGSANIVILPNDDSAVEGNETVLLTLSSHAAYTIGSPASATVTITDNDGSGSCPAEIIRDNLAVGQSDTFRSFTGTWAVSTSTGQFGSNSLYSSGGGLDSYSWKSGVFNASQPCTYRVDVWWTAHANRSTSVPITVSGHSGGSTTLTFNERLNGGKWNTHGTYTFNAGAQATVQVTDQNGQAAADAVRFVLATPPCPAEIIRDNLAVGQSDTFRNFTGTWAVSTSTGQFGSNSLYSNGGGLDSYSWKSGVFNPSQACTYRVDAWWTQHANRSTSVPITVSGHSGGSTTLTFNERLNGGKWNTHGTYTFNAGAQATVAVSDQNGQAAADAVRFVLAPPVVSCPAEIIRDNLAVGQSDTFRSFTGTWTVSTSTGQFGSNSLYSNGGGSDTYSWKSGVFSASQACTYRVDVWWTAHANRSTSVPITVSGHNGAAATLNFNERLNGGKWNTHGTYTFGAGAQATVQVSDQNGQAAADAVRFVLAAD